MIDYLPRSAWNARPPKGSRVTLVHPIGTVLHYPAMGARRLFAQADVASALRGWQDYHMDGKDWADIAYQVAVDQAGRPWDLRGLTTRSAANGNEELNEDYGAILLVLGDTEQPTGAMINTTRLVIADFRRIFPRGVMIKPHSAVRPDGTLCPGNPTRALIAAGQFEPKPVTPEGDSEMNEADRTYVDNRMSAYALWLLYRQLQTDHKVAVAKKDTVAAGVLGPLVTAARKDWEEATK